MEIGLRVYKLQLSSDWFLLIALNAAIKKLIAAQRVSNAYALDSVWGTTHVAWETALPYHSI